MKIYKCLGYYFNAMDIVSIFLGIAILIIVILIAKKYFQSETELESPQINDTPLVQDIKFKTSKINVIVAEDKMKIKAKQNGDDIEILVPKGQIISVLKPTGQAGHCPNCGEIIPNEAQSCPYCSSLIVDEQPEILVIDNINEE